MGLVAASTWLAFGCGSRDALTGMGSGGTTNDGTAGSAGAGESDGDDGAAGTTGGGVNRCGEGIPPECLDPAAIADDVWVEGGSVDLSVYAGVPCILGDLIISEPEFPDLAALGDLAVVCGHLGIGDSHDLMSLEGLESLREVGSLGTAFVPNLESLQPLQNLRAAAHIAIGGTGIETLEGLEGITAVDGALSVKSNQSLRTLDGLENFVEADVVEVIDNRVLESHAVLGNLERVGKRFEIMGFEGTSLGELRSLRSVEGEFRIHLSQNLQSVDAFPRLESVGSVGIARNPALPHDDAVALADSLGPTGYVKIGGNLGSPPLLDPCPWINDGMCDDPHGWTVCALGTDATDCNAVARGAPTDR